MEEYKAGVDRFIKFAIEHGEEEDNGFIRCSCQDCRNKYFKLPNIVKIDLYRHGIMQWYTIWDCHGEKDISQVEVGTSSRYRDDDMYDAHDDNDDNDFEDCENSEEEPNETAKSFYRMVNIASELIYPNNVNFTTLEFSMKLLEWKNKHNCNNNGFDDLLHLIGLVLPDDHKLPQKYYTMRKMIKRLHMQYEKIDAYENDCMLFYKEHGELSHPSDEDEWKQFHRRFQRFSKEIRNVRLGLSTDGFDPFRDKHAKEYTVWPVVVVVYNLPPSMCTKAPYMFMPLLIPGPTDPTKDLHVYLRPLIDELKVLWNTGVETYDMFSRTNFIMKAALLWTISDFHGLAMLSGWSTKEADDPLRRSTKFGSIERRSVCARHSGGVQSLRHNIDIMHTEKNVFDNIFYTILGDAKKTKDNTKSRKDCQELGVHRELWIRGDGTEPHASYTLSKEKVHKLFKWIASLKLLDGYASNISRCVNWEKNCICCMKSHDGHVFMQKLLPIICRDLLLKHVADLIIELCNFFQDICSSTLKYSDLEKMEKDIVRIMSKLETVLTPGLFDPMEHLPLHLATEYKLGGPANGHWMYFIERYLHNLKLKVGNKARAEGSMAQCYIEEECVHFCTLYFDSRNGIMHNKLRRNEAPRTFYDEDLLEVYTYPTHPSLRTNDRMLSGDEYELVAYYVLINSPDVAKYLRGFQNLVQQQYLYFNDAEKEQFQKEQFRDWFERRVQDDEKLKIKFIDLIRGLLNKVESYKACKCNGYKFNCVNANELTSPNSGVIVIGTSYEESYGNYYGRIDEILKLFYHNGQKVIVFKCHWFDHTKHVKVDKHGMTTVDVKSKLNIEDVFVLASQAHQVVWAGPNARKGKNRIKKTMIMKKVMWKGLTRRVKAVVRLFFRGKDETVLKGTIRGNRLLENTPKKTLGHIFRMKFDDQTIWTRGASREAFYSSCIKNFKM
ncbi:uncharacterized protein LOC141695375 [Apium graveolens]|uniref:uncharacterized protein LOC141695375 n=1 Tax=Apium graveolens TaxID=4045 RepID=UPI003D7923E1